MDAPLNSQFPHNSVNRQERELRAVIAILAPFSMEGLKKSVLLH